MLLQKTRNTYDTKTNVSDIFSKLKRFAREKQNAPLVFSINPKYTPRNGRVCGGMMFEF